jgi:hypothetical protein
MELLSDYKIYNNVVFLIPIAVGLYIHVALFTILAAIVFFTSFYYHTVLVKTLASKNRARMIDMITAFACYLYLSYYILYHKESVFQLPLFVGLMATIFVFLVGKYKKSEAIHALFHTTIAVVAGLIGLI